MTTTREAAAVLAAEIDAAIAAVQAASGQARCEAHDAVAGAIVVLLRCQRARLSDTGTIVATAGSVGAAAGAVLATVVEAAKLLL